MSEFSRALDEVFAETLEKAADLLESETYKWIQGDYEHDGAVCAVGALCKAAGETWRNPHPIAQQAAEYMKPYLLEPLRDLFENPKDGCTKVHFDPDKWEGESAVITFNDRVIKDKAEVIEVMKLAAKDVRNQA